MKNKENNKKEANENYDYDRFRQTIKDSLPNEKKTHAMKNNLTTN